MEVPHHQVFISYRHASDEHAAAVRHIGEQLRSAHIEVALDQFFLEENPGGPNDGWPKWCEHHANVSAHILVFATNEWFAVYEGTAAPGEGLGAATEADLFRQTLWDQKGYNARIRLVYLDNIESDKVPVRLRAWEPFRLYRNFEKEFDRLVRWIRASVGVPHNKVPVQPTAPEIAAEQIRSIPNPYPGLATFKPEQHRYFFGRDEDTTRVIEKLDQTRFVSLVGRSGTGKSSLVAAGVEPALHVRHATLTYLRFKPQSNPYRQLAVELDRALPEERSSFGPPRVETIQQALETDPTKAMNDYLGELQSPILLLADQFEELFTQTSAETAQRFRNLLDPLRQRQDLYLVLTLRSEFMDRLMHWLGGEPFAASLVPLDPIEGEQRLRTIIARPSEDNGVAVEPRLISALLLAAGATKGALPLIALALNRLFEQRAPQLGLTFAAYQRMGGLETVVQSIASDIDRAIDAEPGLEQACERLFLELATVIDEVPTRRTAEVEPLRADPEVGRLIEALRAQGFLSDPNRMQIELAHETLLSHWPRLREWCDRYADKLALRRQAEQAAREWQRAVVQESKANNLGDKKHRSDLLRWTWERQRPALEALLDLKHLAPRDDPGYNDPGIHAWYALEQTLAEPLRGFLHPEPLRLLRELAADETTHQRREEIGLRLNQMGDPRHGIGLDENGLPEIDWVEIGEGGEVTLETDPPRTLPVKPFLIARYPITWQQYRAFLQTEHGYPDPRWWDALEQEQEPGEELWGFANYPVVNVSWYDAMAFCRWLSAQLEFEIRLPTEWEWQWAAQAGAESREYPWPGDWNSRRANTDESGIGRTLTVGLYPQGASPHGVMDMAGNVNEWCLNKYNQPEDTAIDASRDTRVLRGGSWFDAPEDARAAYRDRDGPGSRDDLRGFRVVCVSPIR